MMGKSARTTGNTRAQAEPRYLNSKDEELLFSTHNPTSESKSHNIHLGKGDSQFLSVTHQGEGSPKSLHFSERETATPLGEHTRSKKHPPYPECPKLGLTN
jgi:hypothetical protein